MQSQVARVIVPTLYPGLEDHSSVINISKVKGVNQNVFFVTHEHLGVKVHACIAEWLNTPTIQMPFVAQHIFLRCDAV